MSNGAEALANSVIVWIDGDDVIRDVNPAYEAFGAANGFADATERSLGRSLWDFVVDAGLRGVYGALVVAIRKSRRVAHFPYRCDGPDVRRFMEMTMVGDDAGQVVFIHRFLRSEQIADPAAARMAEAPARTMTLCRRCGRVRAGSMFVSIIDYMAEREIELDGAPVRIDEVDCGACGSE